MKLSRGEKFVEARKTHNRNGEQKLKDVYTASGVPASKISALEDDDSDRGVDYREVTKLAKYYGVSLDYLIGDDDDPRPSPDQKAAAAYLGLTDFETKRLHDLLNTQVYRDVFADLLCEGTLFQLLKHVWRQSSSINRLRNVLNDNWETAAYEARHIQRDLSDDLAKELAGITGLRALQTELKAIKARKKAEQEQQNYLYQMQEAELYWGGLDGEHTED